MDEKGLGRRIGEARRAAGLTQQVLCQMANISYSTLAKIERGAIKSPSIFTIQNLVMAMGGSLDALLGLEPASTGGPLSKRSENGVEFIYFDVNGSLVHYSERAYTALAADSGCSLESIQEFIWRHDEAVCSGRMSLAQFETALAALTGLPMVDWTKYYVAAVQPVRGMAEVVTWAAKHYKIGLLTNTMPGLVPALRAAGKLPDIDYAAIIESNQVGAVKPEKIIYEQAEKAAAVDVDKLLLVDDIDENVLAANRRHWQAVRCNDDDPASPQAIRDYLVLV